MRRSRLQGGSHAERVTHPHRRPGYALIAVLIVVVVLSLAAYRYADAMTSEYSVSVRATEAAKAKTAAGSGIHYAMGVLSDLSIFNNDLGGDPSDNPSLFANIPLEEDDAELGGTRFSLFHLADTGVAGEGRYLPRNGIADESAKLNINALILLDPTGQLLYDALMKLPDMTEEIADSIVDWVDSDDSERPAGAETGYYSGLTTPYKAKNGPLNSVEELLLVAGMSPPLLFGNDRNRNGRRDPGEDDGAEFSRGWSEFLTVYGRELDADPSGAKRLNLGDQNADMAAMSQKLTALVGQEISDYIVAARLYGTQSMPTTTLVTETMTSTPDGGTMTVRVTFVQTTTTTQPQSVTGGPNELRAAVQASLDSGTARPQGRLNSVLTLANTRVTLPRAADAPMNAPTVYINSPFNDTNVLKSVLPTLLDWTSTRTTFEMTPRINVNTAPPEVLMTIPGLTQANVDTIVAARDSLNRTDPATTTAAWLVTQADLSPTTFRNIERYVTGKSMTYRVQSVGYFGRGGAIARAEAVIDTNQGHPRIVYYRDLTDLGKGFDLPR